MQAHAMAFGGHFRSQFDLGLHQCCEYGKYILYIVVSSALLASERRKHVKDPWRLCPKGIKKNSNFEVFL